MKKRFILIDGHSVLYRAFHAYPPLTTKSGELVNAVYGFTSILLTVIKGLEPTHIAVCFDLAAPTFRHKEYDGYKASRPEAPKELINQQDRVREVVSVLNIPIFDKEGFEADDVLGTLARKAGNRNKGLKRKGEKLEVVVVTGDRDIFQLIDESVKVYTPASKWHKAKIWGERDVVEKYELTPKQIVDLKALAGDPGDDIPGVRGIGPKTATKLLREFGTMEGVYKNLDTIEDGFGKSVYNKLKSGKDLAKMSKKLATIITKVPVKFSLKACRVHDYNKNKVIKLFSQLDFNSLLKKLPNDTFEQMVQDTMF